MQRHFQKKNRKTGIGLLLAAFFFVLLYFFIFAQPMAKEARISAQWLIDLDNPAPAGGSAAPSASKVPSGQTTTQSGENASPSAAEDVYQFSMGQEVGDYFGYFNGDGKLIYSQKIETKADIPYRVALSGTGFIYYPVVHDDLTFFDTTGRPKRVYHNPGPGFPILAADGGRLFMVKSDLSGIKELDLEGNELWSSDVASWITTLSYSKEFLLCGAGDGTVTVFDAHGTKVSAFALPQSKIDCIYGSAICGTSTLFAGISGAQPQYLFSGAIKPGEKPVIELVPLESDFRREVRMEFSEDGRLLFFEGNRAIDIYNTENGKIHRVPLLGDVIRFSFSPAINMLAVVSGRNNTCEILLLKPPSAVYFKDFFGGQKTFLSAQGRRIFLGVDNKLVCLTLLEE
jgi:hypothetical protein